MTNKPQRPPRPYTDVPAPYGHCSNENCRRALYIPPVASGECCVCDFDRAVAEGEYEQEGHRALLAALDKPADTPTQASFRQGWRDMLRGNTRPVAELWDDIPTPTDGSEVTPITGSAEGDALMYGEDDTPEVGELFDDLAGWEDE